MSNQRMKKDHVMKIRWTIFSAFLLVSLSTAQASATVVAVMPVQGVNLSEGQCDVIGLLFTEAFARETRTAVTPPTETKAKLTQGKPPIAVASELGALEYIELRALQLGARVTVAGIRRAKDGAEIYRAETAASSLDEMEIAVARLARSLAWRQPMLDAVSAPAIQGPAAIPVSPQAPASYPKALGMKTSLIFPFSSGRSIAPMMAAQFDGRMGGRDSFIEFGVGAAIPSSASSGSNVIEMGGVFVELGGSFYLSDGPIAPYLGAGLSPRLWIVDNPNGVDGSGGATCIAYGQAGITFTRDSRARVYAELRVNQYLLGLANKVYTPDGNQTNGNYYPTEFALQLGIGW
jgi:hypothetical protein